MMYAVHTPLTDKIVKITNEKNIKVNFRKKNSLTKTIVIPKQHKTVWITALNTIKYIFFL